MTQPSDTGQANGWAEIIEPSGETAIDQSVPEAILRFRTALATGTPWQRALLEAMGRWTLPEETIDGRRYRYLLLGEAFDWILLAERLCADVDGAISLEEKERFLFSGHIPDTVDEDQFRDFLGPSKYRAYMNFRYGVVLEEALQLVSEEEVRKQHTSRSYSESDELIEEAYTQIYQKPRSELLKTFQQETKKDLPTWSQTLSRNFSRPRSWRLMPSVASCRSTAHWVAMPAWSVPGSQRVGTPLIRRQRTRASSMAFSRAWPRCSSPVTLGGGMMIT